MAVAVFFFCLFCILLLPEKIALSLYVHGYLWTAFITCIQVVFSKFLYSPDTDLKSYFFSFSVEVYSLTYKNLRIQICFKTIHNYVRLGEFICS